MERDKQGKRKAYMQAYLVNYRSNNREVKLTFSNIDYGVIEKIAKKEGLKTSAYMRKAVMEQSKQLYFFPKALEEEMKKAVHVMRGIGNNINQIAKYTNSQRYSSLETLENILNYLYSLEKELKSLKKMFQNKK